MKLIFVDVTANCHHAWMSEWCAISIFSCRKWQAFWQTELSSDFHFFYHFWLRKSSSDKSWALNYNFVLETKIKSVIKLNRKGRICSSTIIKLNCVDSVELFQNPFPHPTEKNDEFLIDLLPLIANFWFSLTNSESSNWRFANLLLGSIKDDPLVQLDSGNDQLKIIKGRQNFTRNSTQRGIWKIFLLSALSTFVSFSKL